MEEIEAQPLLSSADEDKKLSKKKFFTPILLIGSVVVGLAVGLMIGYLSFSKKSSDASNTLSTPTSVRSFANKTISVGDELPECEIFESLSCNGGYDSPGDMNPKFATHLWNTPARGTEGWHEGFQDMNVLVGYPQLRYSQDKKKCTVNVYTKTAKDLDLTYYFDDVAQSSPSKEFDSSYTGLLQIKVVAATGESLKFDEVDFIWNVVPIKERTGDYRSGTKGAIVELFGWPDEDIAKECKLIAEAGYLGVKLFPHQEQLMTPQPMNNELNPWSFMYQPASYRLHGRMGSRTVLRNMIKTCRSYGLRVYADAVVNHMTGGGNDAQWHRNPSASCTYWPPKNTSAGENLSPFYTHSYTYKYNQRGEPSNVLEFPGVPYGPMDFHCDKACNSWACPSNLNTGWLVGLADLDTSKDYVRTRIADFFVDLLSIGFTGFRIDAAKHIHPDDLAAILGKFKTFLGGELPVDWFCFLEVLTGGEGWLLVGQTNYSFTYYLNDRLAEQGITGDDLDKVKLWWSPYPVEPDMDLQYGPGIGSKRKVIQNDDHDQQSDGSSSRSLNDKGCILNKQYHRDECTPEEHRKFEVQLFTLPYGAKDNDNEYPIRMVLSSYYFTESIGIPDGQSDCDKCTVTCEYCQGRKYMPAYVEGAKAYAGKEIGDYTRVHRDEAIIAAMRKWMHIE